MKSNEIKMKNEYAEIRQKICLAHAELVITLLEDITSGDWEECVEIARQELETLPHSDLWLAVRDGILCLIKQREFARAHLQWVPLPNDDECPF